PGGRVGSRQVHDREPDPAAVRAAAGRDPDRRPRHPAIPPDLAAAPHRPGAAAVDPVRRHDPREHRVRETPGHLARARGRGARRAGGAERALSRAVRGGDMMATTADFNSGDSHPQGWARQDTALKGSADSGPGLSLGTPGGVSTLGLPGDAEFPQLAVAGDPARMLEVFRAQLKPARGVGADDIAIEAVMPFRFRCRQRKSRCVLEYTLSLAD